MIGLKLAPAGTVAVSEVPEAAVTVALVAPNQTALLAGVASKFVPVMVTEDPTDPEAGEIEATVGVWAWIWLVRAKAHKKPRMAANALLGMELAGTEYLPARSHLSIREERANPVCTLDSVAEPSTCRLPTISIPLP